MQIILKKSLIDDTNCDCEVFANDDYKIFSRNKKLYLEKNHIEKHIYSAKSNIRNITVLNNLCAISDDKGRIYIVNLDTNIVNQFNVGCNFDRPIIFTNDSILFFKESTQNGAKYDISFLEQNGDINTVLQNIHLYSDIWNDNNKIMFISDINNKEYKLFSIDLCTQKVYICDFPKNIFKTYQFAPLRNAYDYNQNIYADQKYVRFKRNKNIYIFDENSNIKSVIEIDKHSDICSFGWIDCGKHFFILVNNELQILNGTSFELIEKYIFKEKDLYYFDCVFDYSKKYITIRTADYCYVIKV